MTLEEFIAGSHLEWSEVLMYMFYVSAASACLAAAFAIGFNEGAAEVRKAALLIKFAEEEEACAELMWRDALERFCSAHKDSPEFSILDNDLQEAKSIMTSAKIKLSLAKRAAIQ